MAKPKKPAFNMPLLVAIVNATNANSFVYTGKVDYDPLVALGYVEVNPTVINPADAAQFGTRATAAGIAAVATASGGSGVANSLAGAPATAGADIALDDGIAIPAIKRGAPGGGAPSKWPFERMNVGQSFFVAVSADMTNPAKSLASTVASATEKYGFDVKDASGAPVMETVMRLPKGADGKAVKGAAKVPVSVVKRDYTKVFVVRSVDETAQGRGKGARVWREK